MSNQDIKSIHIKKYRTIKDLKVNLYNGLNIIIGKNGAGKSNFLSVAQKAINALSDSNFNENFASIELEIISNKKKYHIEIDFSKKLKQPPSSYQSSEFVLKINSNFIYNSQKDFKNKNLVFENRKIEIYDEPSPMIHSLIGLSFLYYAQLINYNIPQNINFLDTNETLTLDKYDFEYDFKIFVSNIVLNFDINFDRKLIASKKVTVNNILKNIEIPLNIKQNLQKYTPIEDVQFNKNINIYYKGDECIVDNLKLEFKLNGDWLPWSQLSDGTKRLFYMVSEISYHKGIILLEEPELGVHPHQLKLIMQFLREQAEEKQIVISTHSPQVLDVLNPDELDRIFIAKYTPEKGTKFEKLTAAKKKVAKEFMTKVGFLSDYWLISDLED